MFYMPEFAFLHASALVLALVLALFAWRRPRVGRLLYVLLFVWASAVNWTTALTTPSVYLEYGPLALLDLYREIIYGLFAPAVIAFVGAIATCQGLIALGLVFGGTGARVARAGAIAFLIAIAPLGVGSGFPATLIMAFGAAFLRGEALEGPIWRALRDEWRDWRRGRDRRPDVFTPA
jgi:hypothetical protein